MCSPTNASANHYSLIETARLHGIEPYAYLNAIFKASDMEAMYAKFQKWQSEFANNILDMGGALSGEGAVVCHNEVKDGPFVELKEVIGGYMLLTANSLEQAKVVIKASRILLLLNAISHYS